MVRFILNVEPSASLEEASMKQLLNRGFNKFDNLFTLFRSLRMRCHSMPSLNVVRIVLTKTLLHDDESVISFNYDMII